MVDRITVDSSVQALFDNLINNFGANPRFGGKKAADKLDRDGNPREKSGAILGRRLLDAGRAKWQTAVEPAGPAGIWWRIEPWANFSWW
jgi:hypothetical protein